jgi:SAM-dependent methyltransferase
LKGCQLQTEPFGITYDRFRLGIIFSRMVRELDIREAAEIPAWGAKAMPSIYSLALALNGCRVTLVDPWEPALEAWRRLDLEAKLNLIKVDPVNTGLPDGGFDLAWNFVTLAHVSEPVKVLREMARVSRRYVMTVHQNGFNVGYPWHRFLHFIFRFPWTHGHRYCFFPGSVKRLYREAGIRPVKINVLDSPPWPDPPGFRDVRLHRNLPQGETTTEWRVPVVDYYLEDSFPRWMRILSRLEDLPIPRQLKYPVSHLFYVLGEVDR